MDHTFGSQSAAWLEGLATRKRRPVAPSTLDTFSSRVRRLLPIVGADTKLVDIHNGFLKNLGDQLVQQKLAAKTITELIGVVKEIVGSVVDAKGERLFLDELEPRVHRFAADHQAGAAVRNER